MFAESPERGDEMTETWLEEIPREECLMLLRATAVGRIGISFDGLPLVLPVNYRVIEADDRVALVIRTHPGNVIDRSGADVAFEIDGIDESHRRGWSVLVRGVLRHHDGEIVPLSGRFRPDSWLAEPGDIWLTIEPFDISGRRLRSESVEWAFLASAYL
jgi:hypothetical protein